MSTDVRLRDSAGDGDAFDKHGQGVLLARAIVLAGHGLTQEEIMAALAEEFPGKPSENYYLNPAAEAVMRRVREAEQRRIGISKDKARLRDKNLPESYAERDAPATPKPRTPRQKRVEL